MELTKEQFIAAYPDLYAAIVKEVQEEAYSKGLAKGKEEGLASGAEAERNRIKDIESQSIAGHEVLIAELKFDGKTTGAEAAVKILAAEKTLRETKLKSFKEEHTKVVPAAAASEEGKTETKDEDLPLEEKAKKDWDSNAKLRGEFEKLGGFKSYLAWVKNEKNVKILKK